ncbi:unnamed protein product [Caenorhabditis angaria]|uniref:Uncharacterized protein n=1 Tax=Caenorhabditis angaria TaxID=860376 RepID=A0A9P1IPV7_9PELO|nr:unnamed protein product [Caenorhabditis angaria]
MGKRGARYEEDGTSGSAAAVKNEEKKKKEKIVEKEERRVRRDMRDIRRTDKIGRVNNVPFELQNQRRKEGWMDGEKEGRNEMNKMTMTMTMN